MMTDATKPNLYQRLASIAGEVASIKATGLTASRGDRPGVKTLSISDVEDAIRPLMAKHGVVVGFKWNEIPMLIESYERGGKLYQADLTIWAVNADDPSDKREDRVIEFASSPSGAVSFALKRYYRALFHLADDEDVPQAGAGRAVNPPSAGPQRPAPPAASLPAAAPAPKPASGSMAAEVQQRLGEPGPAVAPEVAPLSPATAPGSQGNDHPGLVAKLREAGKYLKSPATDQTLLAMARAKWRGHSFKSFADLSTAQLEAMIQALSGLVDVQNSGAPTVGLEPGVRNPAGEEDVPF